MLVHITIAWQGVRVDDGFKGGHVVVDGSERFGNKAKIVQFDCNYRLSLSFEIQTQYIRYVYIELWRAQDGKISQQKQASSNSSDMYNPIDRM